MHALICALKHYYVALFFYYLLFFNDGSNNNNNGHRDDVRFQRNETCEWKNIFFLNVELREMYLDEIWTNKILEKKLGRCIVGFLDPIELNKFRTNWVK